jgi:hypothetical protein
MCHPEGIFLIADTAVSSNFEDPSRMTKLYAYVLWTTLHARRSTPFVLFRRGHFLLQHLKPVQNDIDLISF